MVGDVGAAIGNIDSQPPAIMALAESFLVFGVCFLSTTAAMPTSELTVNLPYDSSNNLYTFLVLLLAIPGMQIRKRTIGVVTGVALFLCTDFFMTAIWLPYLKTPRPSLANMAASYGWLVVAHYLLPFLLWIVLSYRQIEEMCNVQRQS
jgi:hypothetical protein